MPILGIIASSFRSAAGPVGAYDALATVTVPSGGAATVNFVGIPTGYKHLQIRYIARSNRAVNRDSFNIKFNSSTANAYWQHGLYGDGATAGAFNSGAALSSIEIGDVTGSSAAASTFAAGVIDILDYASTNKNKTIRSLTGADINGAGGGLDFWSGMWTDTTAVNEINLIARSTFSFVEYSQFALYGVK
jgi:hypothetical protein